jgi:Glycosyl hydrolase family 99
VRPEGRGTTGVLVRNANAGPAERIGSLRVAEPGVRRLAVSTAALAEGGPVPGTQPLPPTVLAFYYPWYEVGDWSGGKPIAPDNVNPEPYESTDPAVIDRQLQQAIGAGIDGFIVSWWGSDNPWDANVSALEARLPPGFSFALYVESFSPAFRSEGDLIRELDRALDTHGASDRYLRIDGRPVLYVFSSHNVFQEVSTVGKNPRYRQIWREVLAGLAREGHDPVLIGEGRPFDVEDFDVFDGMHVYGTEDPGITPTRNRQMALTARAWAAVHGGERKIWGASIIPGYDDRHIPGRKPDYFPRLEGALYEAQWASATATHADQALIVSFNEWMETTNIEPNAAWGDQYLQLTSVLAARFRDR